MFRLLWQYRTEDVVQERCRPDRIGDDPAEELRQPCLPLVIPAVAIHASSAILSRNPHRHPYLRAATLTKRTGLALVLNGPSARQTQCRCEAFLASLRQRNQGTTRFTICQTTHSPDLARLCRVNCVSLFANREPKMGSAGASGEIPCKNAALRAEETELADGLSAGCPGTNACALAGGAKSE